jgi:hypothetical protein
MAVSIAGIVVVCGILAATRKEDVTAQAADRKRLFARREKLFADLVKVERDRRSGRGDADRLAARREELIASLEHIYGALDESDAPGAPA